MHQYKKVYIDSFACSWNVWRAAVSSFTCYKQNFCMKNSRFLQL